MTTRIETIDFQLGKRPVLLFMTNFHDNKDWNTFTGDLTRRVLVLYDQLPWQQGLKHTSAFFCGKAMPSFMTNFHDNKDWNNNGVILLGRLLSGFMTNFHDNKDWN